MVWLPPAVRIVRERWAALARAAHLSASRCVAVRSELRWQRCAGKFVPRLPALAGAVIIFLLYVSLLNDWQFHPASCPANG